MNENKSNDLQSIITQVIEEMKSEQGDKFEYYVAAEPPVRCGESHPSGQTEPPCY